MLTCSLWFAHLCFLSAFIVLSLLIPRDEVFIFYMQNYFPLISCISFYTYFQFIFIFFSDTGRCDKLATLLNVAQYIVFQTVCHKRDLCCQIWVKNIFLQNFNAFWLIYMIDTCQVVNQQHFRLLVPVQCELKWTEICADRQADTSHWKEYLV